VRRLLPWLLLLLVPCLLFPGALPGPRVVSADDHLSVHHAWQVGPGGHVHNPHLSDPALQFDALRRRVNESGTVHFLERAVELACRKRLLCLPEVLGHLLLKRRLPCSLHLTPLIGLPAL